MHPYYARRGHVATLVRKGAWHDRVAGPRVYALTFSVAIHWFAAPLLYVPVVRNPPYRREGIRGESADVFAAAQRVVRVGNKRANTLLLAPLAPL
jgi:hypothetical protein